MDEQDLRMATYAAMIDCVDQNMGKIVDTLKTLGVYENTLILFLQDNGGAHAGGIRGSVVRLLLGVALGGDAGRVVIDLPLEGRIVPFQDLSHQFRHSRCGLQPTIEALDRDASAARENVV